MQPSVERPARVSGRDRGVPRRRCRGGTPRASHRSSPGAAEGRRRDRGRLLDGDTLGNGEGHRAGLRTRRGGSGYTTLKRRSASRERVALPGIGLEDQPELVRAGLRELDAHREAPVGVAPARGQHVPPAAVVEPLQQHGAGVGTGSTAFARASTVTLLPFTFSFRCASLMVVRVFITNGSEMPGSSSQSLSKHTNPVGASSESGPGPTRTCRASDPSPES